MITYATILRRTGSTEGLKTFAMRKIILLLVIGPGLCSLPLGAQLTVAGHEVAREEILRSIPEEYINKARTELVVAYQHTSHGTHVSRGVFGLQDYKSDDDQLFGVSLSAEPGKLEFRDYALESYAPEGVTATDLSVKEKAFIQTTRNYLDAPENASVNVVMWSWCNIAGHNAAGIYLPGMDSLISEYGPGGSKIGSGSGQRKLPVTFIYMTGHANVDANTGPLNPKEQAGLITSNCSMNGRYCLDYYSIDTHDMEGNYYEDAGDNGNSAVYGGNFYEDWQNAHLLGTDYFENKNTPGGTVAFGEHNTQHITANRKAYAFWWILARIAGWDGTVVTGETEPEVSPLVFPNPCGDLMYIRDLDPGITGIRLTGTGGATLGSWSCGAGGSGLQIDLSACPPGIYGISLVTSDEVLIFAGKVIRK
jgi:hypothetical protein